MRSRLVILKPPTFIVVLSAMLLGSAVLVHSAAKDSPAQDGFEFFEKKIRPILSDNCYMCHSAQVEKPMSGLRLDTAEGLLKGGNSGQPAVVPGHPEKSRLITALHYLDPDLR